MTSNTSEKETPLIDAKGLRTDGRRLDELRPLRLEVGVLSRADGSAYIEHGRNKILAAVYGPRELHPRHLIESDRAVLRVIYRMATFSVSERKRPAPSRREHEISMVLRNALEPMLFLKLYPRAVVDLYIQVLEADGGSRTASATVASLALADAGIPMRGLVTGCSGGKIDGKLAVDLSDIEDKIGEADVPVVMSYDRGEYTLLQMDGKLTPKELSKLLEMTEDCIGKIYDKQKAALETRYARIREEVGDEGSLEEIKVEAKEPLPPAEKETSPVAPEKKKAPPKKRKRAKPKPKEEG